MEINARGRAGTGMGEMMRESTETIGIWAEETFGRAGSKFRIVARANEELSELLRAISVFDRTESADHIAEEAADVAIVLARLCYECGGTLWPYCLEPPGVIKPTAYDLAGIIALRGRGRTALMRMAVLMSKTPAVEPDIISLKQREDIIDAARRLFVTLAEIAAQCECHIFPTIDYKMAVNRRREWRKDDSGHGYHVRAKGKDS